MKNEIKRLELAILRLNKAQKDLRKIADSDSEAKRESFEVSVRCRIDRAVDDIYEVIRSMRTPIGRVTEGTLIVRLGLSPRTLNTLRTSPLNILTLEELRQVSDQELMNTRGFGKKGLAEVRDLLKKYPPTVEATEE